MPLIELGLVDGNYFADEHVDAIEAAINNCDTRIIANVATLATHTAALATAPTVYAPLIAPRRVSAKKATGQSVANSTTTVITWPEAEDYDTDAIHSIVTNTSRLTIPAGMAGLWHLEYNLRIEAAGSADGSVDVWVQVNGAGDRFLIESRYLQATYPAMFGAGGDLVLAAGDYVEVFVNHTNIAAAGRVFGSITIPSRFRASWRGP